MISVTAISSAAVSCLAFAHIAWSCKLCVAILLLRVSGQYLSVVQVTLEYS